MSSSAYVIKTPYDRVEKTLALLEKRTNIRFTVEGADTYGRAVFVPSKINAKARQRESAKDSLSKLLKLFPDLERASLPLALGAVGGYAFSDERPAGSTSSYVDPYAHHVGRDKVLESENVDED